MAKKTQTHTQGINVHKKTAFHLEKVKERNMLDQWSIEALIMFEEEEVGKGSVDHVRMSP